MIFSCRLCATLSRNDNFFYLSPKYYFKSILLVRFLGRNPKLHAALWHTETGMYILQKPPNYSQPHPKKKLLNVCSTAAKGAAANHWEIHTWGLAKDGRESIYLSILRNTHLRSCIWWQRSRERRGVKSQWSWKYTTLKYIDKGCLSVFLLDQYGSTLPIISIYLPP